MTVIPEYVELSFLLMPVHSSVRHHPTRETEGERAPFSLRWPYRGAALLKCAPTTPDDYLGVLSSPPSALVTSTDPSLSFPLKPVHLAGVQSPLLSIGVVPACPPKQEPVFTCTASVQNKNLSRNDCGLIAAWRQNRGVLWPNRGLQTRPAR